jgi:tetratricopeptide (TPR) repeat protein
MDDQIDRDDESIRSDKEITLRRKVQEEPTDVESILDLASLLLTRKDSSSLSEAKALAKRALDLDPSSSVSNLRLAQVELVEGNLGEAEAFAKKALDLDSNVGIANFVLGQVKMQQFLKAKGRAEKRTLYHEAEKYYESERRINKDFQIPHQKMAISLFFGKLPEEANIELTIALKERQFRPSTVLLFLWTNRFLWLGVILYFTTSILLIGFLSDVVAFTISIPIALGIVALSYFIKNRKYRSVALVIVIILAVLFIAGAAIFWDRYREHAFIRAPIETKPPLTTKAFNFAKVKESYESPKNTILTWVKFDSAKDVRGVWQAYSSGLKKKAWNGDFNVFENDYLKSSAAKIPTIVDVEIKDEKRKDKLGRGIYEYTVFYLQNTSGQTLDSAEEVFVVKEGDQWKLDTPAYLFFPFAD